MKRLLSTFLIALTLTSAVPKAHAVGGIIAGQYVIAAIGGVAIIGGGNLADLGNRLMAQARRTRSTKQKVAGIVAGIVAGVLWVGGGWYLDNENNDFKFLPIQKDNLTQEEAIYNSELEELNAVKDMIAADLSTTEFETIEEVDNFVAAKWLEYGESLSPETMSVRVQIINEMTK